ncbi:Dnase1l3, partial [Symbiodinium sp. CCMP2592]
AAVRGHLLCNFQHPKLRQQQPGLGKASKSEVIASLAEIIARYDLVTIQEISQLPDETGTCGLYTESAICDLQTATTARGRSFSLVASPRIGDEQYAILFDPLVVSYVAGSTYPDNSSTYSRPPYAFHVNTGGISLAVASTHTSPSTAEQEIAAYPQVLQWMEATFAADIYMVAGDFNADGSYFDEDSSWTPIMAQIPNYTLLTGNEMDTTVSVSSNAYDRIIATSTLQADPAAVFVIEDHINLTGVFTQGCADSYISSDICSASPVDWVEVTKELSDHYPVELCMHLNGTSCTTCTTEAPLPELEPGDCAVVGFAADNPDNFGILLLRTFYAGHQIKVTDSGVQSDGALRDGEGILQFDAEEELPAGTVLVFANFSTTEGSFALSSSGDQVIVFTGADSSPTFLCAINFEGSAGEWQSDAASTAESALPPGIEDFSLALPETDNAGYSGPTEGTTEELRQWINTATYWSSSNSQAVAFPAAFAIHTTTTTTASATMTTVTATTSGTATTTSSTTVATATATTTSGSTTSSTTVRTASATTTSGAATQTTTTVTSSSTITTATAATATTTSVTADTSIQITTTTSSTTVTTASATTTTGTAGATTQTTTTTMSWTAITTATATTTTATADDATHTTTTTASLTTMSATITAATATSTSGTADLVTQNTTTATTTTSSSVTMTTATATTTSRTADLVQATSSTTATATTTSVTDMPRQSFAVSFASDRRLRRLLCAIMLLAVSR